VNVLKEEGKKYISNLQWMIKIEKELFMSEKKQLYDYIATIKTIIDKTQKEHDIKIDIPGIKLKNNLN